MNVDEIINKNKLLEEENKKLQEELTHIKEHLKKYTAPASRKIKHEK
jgi:regulator of replication initiation timing